MQDATEVAANPALPIVVGLLLPWLLFLAAFAPRAWWGVSLGILVLLGVLLLVGARWAHREATRQGLDAAWWATLTVLTLGTALLLLSARRDAPRVGNLQFLCHGCGRLGDSTEPFCYGCGEKA